MFRRIAALSLVLAALPARSAGLPPLDARLHYEGVEITGAGLTKRVSYDERLVRREGHVWSERILPPELAGAPSSKVSSEIHAEFDIEGASRHVSRDAQGRLKVEFVPRDRDLVVTVSPAEYEAVAFVSSYEAAGALIDPAAVAKLPRLDRRSPVAGAEWRGEQRGDRYLRVLWSPSRQIALALETGNRQGTSRARTTVTLQPATPDARLPWVGLDRLPQKDYADFSD